MKVIGLDDKEYKLKLFGHSEIDEDRPRSKWHLLAREILGKYFPFEKVLEEILLPGCGYTLYLDFFLPRRKLAIEVQGVQHKQYVPFFHGDINGYRDQLKRDFHKKNFCIKNNFTLLELDDGQSEQWPTQIRATFS